MLKITDLSILQFRNYSQASFQFKDRIIGICGKNGAGKTNLLDAVYYLCFTKSYFNRPEIRNCQEGTLGFRLDGWFERNEERHQVIAILRENGKKEFLHDQEPYDKFSLHIGRYPSIMIAPDDVQLISGGAEERRKFIDGLIAQLDLSYLDDLINYNRVLQQRNSLLKSFAENQTPMDTGLLEVLDQQLTIPGNRIFEKRKEFMVSFLPGIRSFYLKIAGKDEAISLEYQSALLKGDFTDLLSENRKRDLYSQRTQAGIHRDELDIRIGNHFFRNIASQGQRKSLLFALKLAAFEELKQHKGFAPILLLDDIFEKLDDERMNNLLQWTCVSNEGQIFITDTHEERLSHTLRELGLSFQLEILGD